MTARKSTVSTTKPETKPGTEVKMEPTVKPTPDPTVLTTQQLHHDIANLKEQLSTRVEGVEKVFDVRISCAEKTVAKVEAHSNGCDSIVDAKIAQLEKLQQEKFNSIEKQFIGNGVALSAALQAAEKAVEKQNTSNTLAIDKSEKATAKQIEGIISSINSQSETQREKLEQVTALNLVQINALKDQISSLKNFQVMGEGHSKGSSEVIAWVVAGLMLLATIIASFVAAANWVKVH